MSWHVANNISGEYKPTLTYRASVDVPFELTIGEHDYKGVFEKGEGTLKHPVPPMLLNRIGIYPITLSVAADSPDHDLVLTDFRLNLVPSAVVMSKPVLIAGGDWVKVQASLKIDAEAIDASKLEVHGVIKPQSGDKTLWEGKLDTSGKAAGLEIDAKITGLQPKLWSTDDPNLYQIALEVRKKGSTEPKAQCLSRFGFREFEARDGRFYLNGQAVFLRGNSIMPPGGWGHVRGIAADLGHDPAEIRKYIAKLKEFNVNLVRVHDPLWLSICDEMGMMVFTGRYGVPQWGGATRGDPPAFAEGAVTYYKQRFSEAYMNHPSVVIWVLTNEMPSAMSEVGHEYIVFLRQVFDRLSKWDPTRAYIDNAGFGLGQATDIYDLHVYVGWYNGIVQSLYKFRDDLRALAGLPSPEQPITFTEMIGAYTDTLGRMPATGKMVSASLMWAGNEVDVPEHALHYQLYLTQTFNEIIRRMRSIRPALAGLMPFTTTANEWEVARSVDELQWKPHITEGYTTSYQPVLLSFENWKPHIYAGDELPVTAHLVNDADDGRDLSKPLLRWDLIREKDADVVESGELAFDATVEHYATDQRKLVLKTPESLATGQYILKGEVVENGRVVSVNETPVWIEERAEPKFELHRKVILFDPLNETKPVLEKVGLVEGRDFHMTASPFAGMKRFDRLSASQLQETLGVEGAVDDTLVAPSESVMIVGPRLWVEPLRDKYLLMKEFIHRGGRVLFLNPNEHALSDIGLHKELLVMENEWIGDRTSVNMESLWHTSRNFGAWINPRRSDNNIFDGVDREQLWLWSDSSGWDPSQKGLPEFEPVDTFLQLRDGDALDTTAVLANFGRGLEHVALAEVFRGEGSVILSGFDFDRFAGLEPIADKVLRGIIQYAADDQEHHIVPPAKAVTNIGSPSDEAGQIPCEFRNGLLMEYYKGYDGARYHRGFEGQEYQVRRIMGPFWFNRLCHTKPINPEERIRHGFMHVRPPEGSSEVVFEVRRVPTRG
ncbi:MAG TPA: glycoside hydrolase family 2 TIM barrel-domain containing protein, partial [Opitutales bacterium]|nr:glycoside hydrolase family 2 TIM barrel-domain containing protein [Opitutales bacterium]